MGFCVSTLELGVPCPSHKFDLPPRRPRGPGDAEQRQSLNMAAHKLGHWAPAPPRTSQQAKALAGSRQDVVAYGGRAALALGALGVVYGDIGTSPLYTEQVIFDSYHATA